MSIIIFPPQGNTHIKTQVDTIQYLLLRQFVGEVKVKQVEGNLMLKIDQKFNE